MAYSTWSTAVMPQSMARKIVTPVRVRAVDPLARDAVPFLDAVGDVELDRLRPVSLKEQVEHRRAVRAVDVIVAEHEQSFSLASSAVEDAR